MLALVGSGEYLAEVDPIDTVLIGRLSEPARVVCLPTAAGQEGEAMVNSWMQRGTDHFTRLGVSVKALPVIDRASAEDEAHAEAIRQANFVYMSGGNPGYLAKTFEKTAVWQAIRSVDENGGVVAGCSAGAMIMGERIMGPGGNRTGFNLLPNTIIMPHFDEFPGILNRVMRLFSDKSLTMLGIDGRTALVKNEAGYEILGTGGITIIKRGSRQTFTSGPLPNGLL